MRLTTTNIHINLWLCGLVGAELGVIQSENRKEIPDIYIWQLLSAVMMFSLGGSHCVLGLRALRGPLPFVESPPVSGQNAAASTDHSK